MTSAQQTQNSLLLRNLTNFYNKDDNMDKMLNIINGESTISLRIVDWFATNYSKQYYITYDINDKTRFKVYVDYKLKLRAYSKKRFDPFCRWDRISIPYKDGQFIQTTIGQLNFFKWAIENNVIEYIRNNYSDIETDMNSRNSTAKRNQNIDLTNKTRKKREELSVSASKSVHREDVKIIVNFN
jgi:hypothetical protein